MPINSTTHEDSEGDFPFFASLMPQLEKLRQKGCSFRQITTALDDAGVSIDLESVQTYYTECIAMRMEACEAHFDEQLSHLARLEHRSTVPVPKGKTRLTIFVDTVVLEKLKEKASVRGTVDLRLIDEALLRAVQGD